ncbi:DnaJ-like protein subfamily B member 5 [Nematocida minor]|uniref:DnaJ-like protein subfamily B member 5 n=1 Tax=Nematocida minor TaxID=1912983 RepID=UPI0022208044|nr:DnaJ-like protein subfamily B member 5 [Nematocida minor]KAI5192417.1 DnaJ-like protein subfamily B member 5 [Nematocida minor]
MDSKKSLYTILNVNKNATESEIRSAYKALARKYHPDMHTNKSETEKKKMQDRFKEINAAYEVLTDKKKREFYDATGMTQEEAGQRRPGGDPSDFGNFNFNFGGGGRGSGGGSFGNGFSFTDFESAGSGGFDGFSDIGSIFGGGRGNNAFENIFGRGKRHTHGQSQGKEKNGPNAILEYKMAITLEEICTGSLRKIRIRRRIPSGEREETVLDVNVLPGYKFGTKITYANAGDCQPDGSGTDIVVVLIEKPHAYYKVSGNDIIYEFDIGIKEYLSGFKKVIKGLKDNNIVINSEIIGDNSKDTVLEGEGLPDRTKSLKRGNLIVKPRIIVNLSAREKSLVCNALL